LRNCKQARTRRHSQDEEEEEEEEEEQNTWRIKRQIKFRIL